MKQKDIAALCGVSPATVTKALHNSHEISSDVKKRIRKIADDNNVVIKTRRSNAINNSTILMFVPEYRSEYYGVQLSDYGEQLKQYGYSMLSSEYGFDYNCLENQINKAFNKKISGGIIIIGYDDTFPELNLKRVTIPIVVIHSKSGLYDSFCYNIDLIMQKVIMGLMEAGHKRIAFIGDRYTVSKESSFSKAAKTCGLTNMSALVFRSEQRFNYAGIDGFRFLYSLPEPPTAIICGYDYIVLGVLNCAENMGILVPHDLSVIGCDNIRASSSYRLGITTIEYNDRQLCDDAVALIDRRIKGTETGAPKFVMVNGSINIRGTAHLV